MRKWWIALLAAVALLIIAPYIFIPAKLNIVSASYVLANENGAFKYIADTSNWSRWWKYSPADTNAAGSYLYNCSDNNFKLTEKQYRTVKIDVEHKGRKIESIMHLFAIKIDSSVISWECKMQASNNPVKRIIDYQEAMEIKKCMETVLVHLKNFLENKENVYGISLERTTVKDTLLISTKAVSPTYPSTSFIYGLVNKLQKYAQTQGAKQTGNPIYNVTAADKHFNVMVAIPLNQALSNAGEYEFKKMIPGSFIVTTVTGGEQTVNYALQQIHQYFEDYHLTSMAINFKMLVTDRTAEPDSTKWVTRIYQPVY